MEEQEGLKRKLRRLEANLRRMQVARAETVARKRAEDNRMKEGKSSCLCVKLVNNFFFMQHRVFVKRSLHGEGEERYTSPNK